MGCCGVVVFEVGEMVMKVGVMCRDGDAEKMKRLLYPPHPP